ncbi:MAG: NADH-quinone oxidoreductase subunit C [Candidatus Zixiibacteriota bacterium]|jgi:NADH-quinone oxidoreductase subunit C
MSNAAFDKIAARLKETFGDAVVEVNGEGMLPFVRVEPASLARVARFLKDEAGLGCDFLMFISAVDYPEDEKITLVYQYFSYEHQHEFMVKADVPRAGAAVPTVTHLYAAADWLEREVFDLFGVTFEGHPNMTRLLTPEGFTGHPLLKDFTNEDYIPFPDVKPGK